MMGIPVNSCDDPDPLEAQKLLVKQRFQFPEAGESGRSIAKLFRLQPADVWFDLRIGCTSSKCRVSGRPIRCLHN